MNTIKDYFGHEIHEGDVVLYSNDGEFEEGVIILIKPLLVLDSFLLEEYKNGSKGWVECFCNSESKFADELINLTALDISERVDIGTINSVFY